MQQIAAFLFWSCLILILHTHVLYPAVLYLIPRGRVVRPAGDPGLRPHVSILFSAYNEEGDILQKLHNIARLTYPADHLEVVVGSDGSTDRTCEIVERFAAEVGSPKIRLLSSAERAGKTRMLNRLADVAEGEVLILTDTNSMFSEGALEQLVQHFVDPQIGLVCGELQYREVKGDSAGRGEGLYWRLEQKLKVLESRYNSLVGANGAIYAVRKELFEPLPIWSCDDFETGLQVYQKGFRVVYEPAATAFERTPGSMRGEFQRKTRMITRQLYSISRHTVLLNPFSDPIGFQIISHKVLRWFAAHLAILLLIMSALLSGGSVFFTGILAAQVLFYLVALLGLIFDARTSTESQILFLPYYFCAMHAAGAVATVQYLLGKRVGIWNPVRPESGESDE